MIIYCKEVDGAAAYGLRLVLEKEEFGYTSLSDDAFSAKALGTRVLGGEMEFDLSKEFPGIIKGTYDVYITAIDSKGEESPPLRIGKMERRPTLPAPEHGGFR